MNNQSFFSSANNSNMFLPNLQLKLDHKNFFLWKHTISTALEAFGLEKFLLSTSKPEMFTPSPTTDQRSSSTTINPDYTTWKQKDRLILLWLRSHLSEQILGYTISATTTHEAWLKIDTLFQATSEARVNQLRDQLHHTQKGSVYYGVC